MYMFYKQGRRIMTWRGIMHHTWMQPTRGLIQGCPLSPLALATIMSRWAVAVENVAAASVYADDRAAWCVSHSPEEAAQSVAEVLRVSRGCGAKHGFANNVSKAQVFASTAEGKEAAGGGNWPAVRPRPLGSSRWGSATSTRAARSGRASPRTRFEGHSDAFDDWEQPAGPWCIGNSTSAVSCCLCCLGQALWCATTKSS